MWAFGGSGTFISDALPFGRLRYGEPNAVSNAMEIAGVIEKVGKGVGKLKPVERVGLSALFPSRVCR
jgi:hypothetical protein